MLRYFSGKEKWQWTIDKTVRKRKEELRLYWYGLGVEGSKYLTDVVLTNENATVQTLRLDTVSVGVEGMRYLNAGIKVNKTIKVLSFCNIGIGDKAMWYLADALKVNQTVKELEVQNNPVGDKGMRHLSNALKVNQTVKKLVLRQAQFGDKGMRYLSDGLTVNQTVEVLWLGHDGLLGKGVQYLCHAVKVNQTLRELNLGYLDNQGTKCLLAAVRVNISLTKVSTYHEEISDVTVALADMPARRAARKEFLHAEGSVFSSTADSDNAAGSLSRRAAAGSVSTSADSGDEPVNTSPDSKQKLYRRRKSDKREAEVAAFASPHDDRTSCSDEASVGLGDD